ncbi:hypothetical protein [Dictyobacter alpinus]|uniref:hypothetical protein n=1 Tax=Dictyobacter alpinus TaxID=2014873 RepID=UPI000F8191CD|nr:hypothetical protein [Dictyobacter alpinus]
MAAIHATITGQALDVGGEVFIYICFFIFLFIAMYTYIKEPKPFLRGTLGIISILIITILYFVGIIFFPGSRYIPTFMHSSPPSAAVFTIGYLTLVRRPYRVVTIIMAVLLVLLVVSYISAVLFD